MPDDKNELPEEKEEKPELSKLSTRDYEHKKAEFMRYQKQVASAAKVERVTERRADAPKADELANLSTADYEKRKREFFKQ